jgi:hypothetical protein
LATMRALYLVVLARRLELSIDLRAAGLDNG